MPLALVLLTDHDAQDQPHEFLGGYSYACKIVSHRQGLTRPEELSSATGLALVSSVLQGGVERKGRTLPPQRLSIARQKLWIMGISMGYVLTGWGQPLASPTPSHLPSTHCPCFYLLYQTQITNSSAYPSHFPNALELRRQSDGPQVPALETACQS